MGAILRPYQPKKRYIPKHEKPELHLQRQVCSLLRIKFPEAIFASDFASGMYLSPYQAKLRASLMSGRGWPDILIYNKRRGYSGLAIELKKEGTRIYLTTGPRKGKLTTDPHIQSQASMLQALINEGWFGRFCIGYDNTEKLLNWYFSRPKNAELF